jgi:DNA-binding Lrp family transcriptional regulator
MVINIALTIIERGDKLHQVEEYRAYVLIKVHSGKDLEVFEKIRDLQHRYPLTEVAMVYGDYDLITRIRITRPKELEDFVFTELRQIEGIAETKTLITARFVEFR